MARTILNVGDQAGVGAMSGVRTQFIEQCAKGMHDFDVLLLVMTADVVGLANNTFSHDFVQSTGVIFDIEPVTNLVSLAINRQGLAFQRVKDDQRDQLLREVAWAIVIRAVGDQYRQAVGTAPGANQVIGAGLTGRVRRAWVIRCGFGEEVFRTFKVSVDFVSRNVVKTEVDFARIIQRRPVMACSFQQGVSANDIGLDGLRRPRDRSINMRLCGQVHDRIWLIFMQDAVELIPSVDVDALKHITRVPADFGQRLKVTGISQLIDVNDRVGSVGDDMTDDC